MREHQAHVELVGDLCRNLHSQVVLVRLFIDWSELMEDQLAFLGRSILEVDLKVAARPHFDALSALVLAQIDSVHELGLNLDLTDQLHLEVGNFLLIENLAICVFSSCCCRDLDKLWHASDVSTLDVAHHAEEALQVVDLATGQHKVFIATFALDANPLPDERDSIKLHSRHHFFGLSVQEEFDSHSVFRCAVKTAPLIVSVDDKLALLIKLAVSYFTDVHDAGGIEVVAQQDVCLALAPAHGFARLRLDRQDSRVARVPEKLLLATCL